MSKQDRQGVRTPAALERKYRFGKQIKDTNSNVAKQEKQVQQNSQELHVFMGATNSAIADIRRRMFDVEELTSSMSDAIIALEEFASASEVDLIALFEKLEFLEAVVSGVQDDVTGIIMDAEILSASVEELQTVVSELGETLSEHDASIATLIERVTALEEAETEEPTTP